MLLQSTTLEKYYGKRPVVKKVSIEVNRGEIVGLLGPNGAGKTTTFYMLVGFIRPDAGHVFLGADEITRCLCTAGLKKELVIYLRKPPFFVN